MQTPPLSEWPKSNETSTNYPGHGMEILQAPAAGEDFWAAIARMIQSNGSVQLTNPAQYMAAYGMTATLSATEALLKQVYGSDATVGVRMDVTRDTLEPELIFCLVVSRGDAVQYDSFVERFVREIPGANGPHSPTLILAARS